MLHERTLRGQSLRIECSEHLVGVVGHVFEAFEGLEAAGTPLAAGVQLRFGWSLLHLAAEDPALRVTEPVFSRWPELHWNPRIDTTLEVLAAQVSLLRKLALAGEDIAFDQVLLMPEGTLGRRDVFLHRAPRLSDLDSGWTLSPLPAPDAAPREEDLQAVPIASLASRRPALLSALTLPEGFMAVFSGDSLEQVFNASGQRVYESSRV